MMRTPRPRFVNDMASKTVAGRELLAFKYGVIAGGSIAVIVGYIALTMGMLGALL